LLAVVDAIVVAEHPHSCQYVSVFLWYKKEKHVF